jgi:hypothetical protein
LSDALLPGESFLYPDGQPLNPEGLDPEKPDTEMSSEDEDDPDAPRTSVETVHNPEAASVPNQHGHPTSTAPENASGAQETASVAQETASGAQETTSTATEWPWTTGLTADGNRIMMYRTHAKGYRCMIEERIGVPVYKIVSGASCGRLEVKNYLGLEGIKQLPLVEDRVVWKPTHQDKFKELKWIGISEYGVHNPDSKSGSQRRDPESWCGVVFDWGLETLTTSEFRKVLGPKSANTQINNLCNAYQSITPMDREPLKELVTPRQRRKTNAPIETVENADTIKPVLKEYVLPAFTGEDPDAPIKEALTGIHNTLGNMEDRFTAIGNDIGTLNKLLAMSEKRLAASEAQTSALISMMNKLQLSQPN